MYSHENSLFRHDSHLAFIGMTLKVRTNQYSSRSFSYCNQNDKAKRIKGTFSKESKPLLFENTNWDSHIPRQWITFLSMQPCPVNHIRTLRFKLPAYRSKKGSDVKLNKVPYNCRDLDKHPHSLTLNFQHTYRMQSGHADKRNDVLDSKFYSLLRLKSWDLASKLSTEAHHSAVLCHQAQTSELENYKSELLNLSHATNMLLNPDYPLLQNASSFFSFFLQFSLLFKTR